MLPALIKNRFLAFLPIGRIVGVYVFLTLAMGLQAQHITNWFPRGAALPGIGGSYEVELEIENADPEFKLEVCEIRQTHYYYPNVTGYSVNGNKVSIHIGPNLCSGPAQSDQLVVVTNAGNFTSGIFQSNSGLSNGGVIGYKMGDFEFDDIGCDYGCSVKLENLFPPQQASYNRVRWAVDTNGSGKFVTIPGAESETYVHTMNKPCRIKKYLIGSNVFFVSNAVRLRYPKLQDLPTVYIQPDMTVENVRIHSGNYERFAFGPWVRIILRPTQQYDDRFNVEYRWQKRREYETLWTNIEGASGSSYTFQNLRANTYFRRITLLQGEEVVSNVVMIKALTLPGGKIEASRRWVERGDSVVLKSVYEPVSERPGFGWYAKVEGDTVWNQIGYTSSSSFRVPAVKQTTTFWRKAWDGLDEGWSNQVTVTVRSHQSMTTQLATKASTEGTAGFIEEVEYSDGFGRICQTIGVEAAPGGGDLICPVKYMEHNRSIAEYLPYTKKQNRGRFDYQCFDPDNWSMYGVPDNHYAYYYSETEGSPLNRLRRMKGPGSLWWQQGKEVSYDFLTNKEGQVKNWSLKEGLPVCVGTYEASMLQHSRITDEDGAITEKYSDPGGKMLLEAKWSNGQRNDTYYVYDERGRLCYVLPPIVSDSVGNDGTVGEKLLERYAYFYQYDTKGRLIARRLPGVEIEYQIYDARDRVVMSQDARQKAAGCWSYCFYDTQGRVSETGEVVAGRDRTRENLQQLAEDTTDFRLPGMYIPYKYYIYDHYNNRPHFEHCPFAGSEGFCGKAGEMAPGRLTGIKTWIMGTDQWINTSFYYDHQGRLVQQVQNNRLEGVSRYDYAYDFGGKVVGYREEHTRGNGGKDVAVAAYTHDLQGRLLKKQVTVNGKQTACLEYEYDQVGRLKATIYGEPRKQVKEENGYNIRGWLTTKSSPLFRTKLYYTDCPQGGQPYFDGTITGWEWQHGANPGHLYTFQYDDGKRLLGAEEYQWEAGGWVPDPQVSTEQNIRYDRQGNILGLQRWAKGHLVDDLEYSYEGNRLVALREKQPASVFDIYPYGEGTYEFDATGNMVSDRHKGLWINYNCYNLPTVVYRNSVPVVHYIYLGDGTKIAVKDGSGQHGLEYLGSFVYGKNGNRYYTESCDFGEGRIYPSVVGNDIRYQLADHLGSVRCEFNAAGQVVGRNDYYPFGERHMNPDFPMVNGRAFFNGKEEQQIGNLAFLDYGARLYDTKLGRWMSIDPLTEKQPACSPYHFCLNNPVNYIDPDGRDAYLYDITTRQLNWYNDMGGHEQDYVMFVMAGIDGGLQMLSNYMFLDKVGRLIIESGGNGGFYWGECNGGLAISHTNYWDGIPTGLQGGGMRGEYRYNAEDLQMRRRIMNGSSHALKMALLISERNRGMQPLTGSNFGRVYGSVLGKLMVGCDYLSHFFVLGTMGNSYSGSLRGSAVWSAFGQARLTAASSAAVQNGAKYTVYMGKDSEGIVRYVGITKRDPIVRFKEHWRAKGTGREKLKYEGINRSKMSEIEAHIQEQKLINHHGMQKNGGTLLNRKNSIAPKYWDFLGIP